MTGGISNLISGLSDFRTNSSDTSWEIPPWGHPISELVMPLFMIVDGNYRSVGTAFLVSKKLPIIITATHNIKEAVKHDPALSALVHSDLEGEHSLKNVRLSVLHQRQNSPDNVQITLWPIETIHGPAPTDVVTGSLKAGGPTGDSALPLCFDLPRIGADLLSIGYSFDKEQVISVATVDEGNFDWENDYHHRLIVTEGKVDRIFATKFAKGFFEGPCFSFDNEIRHAMSGGPMLSKDGVVHGINSAGATEFFGSPMSLGSLLHQLLPIKVKSGIQLGPLRMNSVRPFLELVLDGTIESDGSAENIGYSEDERGRGMVTHPSIVSSDKPFIHDCFRSYQDNASLSVFSGPVSKIRRKK